MSTYLLDTQVWLWMNSEPTRIASKVLELIRDRTNVLLLSAASTWEIAIKCSIGKLSLPEPAAVYVSQRATRNGVTLLPIEHDHVARIESLPMIHRDPFDRLLVAQSAALDVPLISADPVFDDYSIRIVNAG